jgi:hypothetical protein
MGLGDGDERHVFRLPAGALGGGCDAFADFNEAARE